MDEKKNENLEGDVTNQHTGESWYYSDIAKDHFFNPRNFLADDENEEDYDAMGMIGNIACGDVMKMWLKIEPKTERIKKLKWRTFGCGSAIATTSMFSVIVTENGGLTIAEALKITPQKVTERLGGLPNRKIHCAVLACRAFRKAANDYFCKTGQEKRIIKES